MVSPVISIELLFLEATQHPNFVTFRATYKYQSKSINIILMSATWNVNFITYHEDKFVENLTGEHWQMKLEMLSRGGNAWFITECNRITSGNCWEVETNENKITTHISPCRQQLFKQWSDLYLNRKNLITHKWVSSGCAKLNLLEMFMAWSVYCVLAYFQHKLTLF